MKIAISFLIDFAMAMNGTGFHKLLDPKRSSPVSRAKSRIPVHIGIPTTIITHHWKVLIEVKTSDCF